MELGNNEMLSKLTALLPTVMAATVLISSAASASVVESFSITSSSIAQGGSITETLTLQLTPGIIIQHTATTGYPQAIIHIIRAAS
jgi:hypothetical protein